MKSETYVQCTLTRTADNNHRVELVEWVPKHLAVLGKRVVCKFQHWTIAHVGQESDDPRSAHECHT